MKSALNGLLAFKSMDLQGIHPFARRGLELLASGVSTAVLEDALNREVEACGRMHMAAAHIWQHFSRL